MDEKTRTRQNASRAARVARGERQVAVWLSADTCEALRVLTQYGATETAAINQALRFALTDVSTSIGGNARTINQDKHE